MVSEEILNQVTVEALNEVREHCKGKCNQVVTAACKCEIKQRVEEINFHRYVCFSIKLLESDLKYILRLHGRDYKYRYFSEGDDSSTEDSDVHKDGIWKFAEADSGDTISEKESKSVRAREDSEEEETEHSHSNESSGETRTGEEES